MPAIERRLLIRRAVWKAYAVRVTRSRCMVCLTRHEPAGLDVHEIERRSQSPGRWADPCNYLLVCRDCHAGPLAAMPHAHQLAYKLLFDTRHFDLERWLRLRDPGLSAPERVTSSEVIASVRRLAALYPRKGRQCAPKISAPGSSN